MGAQQREDTLDEYRERLSLSADALKLITQAFTEQLEAGLENKSSLLMIPTMVDMLPQGHESGEYYAIDLGGTNLRVLFTRLGTGPKEIEAEAIQSSAIPPQMQSCPVEELMDYVAGHLISWSEAHHCSIREREAPVVGFCFSFPVQQTAVDAGRLLRWTKGFENPGAVGRDPARLLAEAFLRQGVSAQISALVNDTVGTLAAVRYVDGSETMAAVIMGTGTNACYIEQLGAIRKWLPHYRPRTPDMVVNIEWPGFRSPALPVLAEDDALDADTNNPGQQRFEKLTAGLYLGDIARRIILRCAEAGCLFGGRVPESMRGTEAFSTKDMAAAAQDATPDLATTAGVLEHAFGLEADSVSAADRQQVKEVCALVTRRSARLIAAALCGILVHLHRDGVPPADEQRGGVPPGAMGRSPPRTCVAVDGGIFVRYGFYRELLRQGVRDILGDAVADRFDLHVVPGGSAFGAACVAAASHSYMRSVDNGTYRGPSGFVAPAPVRKFPPRRASQDGGRRPSFSVE